MNELINQTLGKLNRNRNLYKTSEFAVRDHLVNPILTHLGWDVTDAEYVIPNQTTDEGSTPGYVLVKEGKTLSFVEPRGLAEDLQDHIPTLVLHCQRAGVEFGILSNGLQWMLLKTFGTGLKPKERIVWQINLERDSPMSITKRLRSVDHQHIGKIENLLEKEKVLHDAWENYLRQPDELNVKIAEVFISKVAEQHPNIEFDGEDTRLFYRRKLKDLTYHRQLPGLGQTLELPRSRGELPGAGLNGEKGEPANA